MTESDILARVRLAASRTFTLFRNNVALAWTGEIHRRGESVTIHNPRPLHAGLCRGSADLIGWKSIMVTPEMIGQKIAVLTAAEVKTARRKSAGQQRPSLDVVAASGGIAAVARRPEDVEGL